MTRCGILSRMGHVMYCYTGCILDIVIKGVPQARLKPRHYHSLRQRLTSRKAPRLKHFQGFLSFFFFFFSIFSPVELRKEALGFFFFFCNRDQKTSFWSYIYFFFLNRPKRPNTSQLLYNPYRRGEEAKNQLKQPRNCEKVV